MFLYGGANGTRPFVMFGLGKGLDIGFHAREGIVIVGTLTPTGWFGHFVQQLAGPTMRLGP